MLKLQDRVKELTTTSGTGTLTLSGTAEAGFQAFSVLGNGTKTYYTISDVNGTDFEIGLGTYSSNTLTRDTIFESSNSGNAISLSATGSTVFVTYPAEKSSYRDIGVNRDYTASGSITAGKPLILNADNTVTQVAETPTTIPAGLGTKTTTALASSVYDQQVAMGINGQFVSVYRQGNDFMCQVNTVSTDDLKTITHGTSQLTFNLSSSTDVGIIYQPDANKYVLFYKDSNSYLTGSVMTVSGTGASATLTTATAVTLRSTAMNGSPNNSNLTYDTSSDLLIACWTEGSAPKTVSMPISGSTISANTVESVPMYGSYVNSYSCRCAYSSTANKVVYLYADNNTEDLYTTVGTVSGSSFSFGSTAIVGSLPTGNFNGGDACVGVDNNGVVVLSYLAQDITPAYTLFSQAGTLSGTTITWGSPSQVSNVTCLNNATNECSIAPISSGKMIIARATKFASPSNSFQGIFAIVTSSGTTVSNGSVQTFSSTESRYPCLAVNYSKTQAVINWGDASSMDINNIVYLESQQSGGAVTNLTNDNYFGIASTTASTTEPVGVNRAGSFNNDQTGMTAGKDMYVTNAGLIKERTTTTTTPDTNPTVSLALDTSFYSQSNGVSGGGMAYESTSGTYVVFASNQGNNQYPTLMAGTLSNGTMTYGTPLVVNSANSGSGFSNYICAGNGKIYVSFHSYESSYWYVWCKWYTISGTTFTGNSAGNVSLVTTSTTRQISTTCGYDSNADRVIFGYAVNDSTVKDLYYRTAEVTATGFTLGTVLSIGSTKNADNTDVSIGLEYDNNAQRFVLAYLDGSTVYPEACVLEVGSSTITKGTEVTLINEIGTQARPFASTYDSVNNKITLLWRSDAVSSSYAYYTTILTVNSATNSFTFTTPAQIFSPNTGDGYQIEYDASTSKFLVLLDKQAPSYDNDVYMLIFTSNGSALTLISTTLVNTSKIDGSIAGATSSNGTAFYGRLDNGSNNNATITAYFGSTTSTVVNGSQFVGTARSGSDLELAEPPTELVGMANGSITKGKPVVVRTDGDFESVTPTSINFSKGTPATITTAYEWGAMSFDVAQNKYLYAYKGYSTNTGKLVARIGTPSGTGTSAIITWGSEILIDNSLYPEDQQFGIDMCYDPEYENHIVVYENSSNQDVEARILTISGTNITSSSSSTVSTSNPSSVQISYASNHKKYIVCFMSSQYIRQVVGSQSSGSTSWGSTTYDSGTYLLQDWFAQIYDSNSSALVLSWQNNNNYGVSLVCPFDGTSFTYGSATNFYTGYARVYARNLTFDSTNNKIINAYKDNTSQVGTCIIGTVSGSSISWATGVNFSSSAVGYPSIDYDSNAKKFVISYQDQTGNYYMKAVEGSVTGTTPTIIATKEITGITSSTLSPQVTQTLYDSVNNQIVMGVHIDTNKDDYYCIITPSSSSTNLSSNNFIGFAQNTVADNEDVKVKVISQSDKNQTGLTTASTYYVQNDGTLSTTAGTPSVLGGTALSSTKILIKS